jgi:hypothetical protein
MRRAGAAVYLIMGMAACESTEPPPPFPEVAGIYKVEMTFDDFPATVRLDSGTIVLEQPSRHVGTLAGTANIRMLVAGSPIGSTPIRFGSVDEAGAITFQIPPPSESFTWTFTGTASGSKMSGAHVYAGSRSVWGGGWSARKLETLR